MWQTSMSLSHHSSLIIIKWCLYIPIFNTWFISGMIFWLYLFKDKCYFCFDVHHLELLISCEILLTCRFLDIWLLFIFHLYSSDEMSVITHNGKRHEPIMSPLNLHVTFYPDLNTGAISWMESNCVFFSIGPG